MRDEAWQLLVVVWLVTSMAPAVVLAMAWPAFNALRQKLARPHAEVTDTQVARWLEIRDEPIKAKPKPFLMSDFVELPEPQPYQHYESSF